MALALGAVAPPARAEIEAGGFVGAHLFSTKSLAGRYRDDTGANSLNHMATGGIRLAWLPVRRLAIEAELAVVPTDTRDGSSTVVVTNGRLALVANLALGRVRPFLYLGAGVENISPANPVAIHPAYEPQAVGGLGLRVDIGRAWGLRLDARVAVGRATGDDVVTPDLELTVGFYGRFPRPEQPTVFDRDLDGITDERDKCPDQAGPPEGEGCPEAPASTPSPAPAAGGTTP